MPVHHVNSTPDLSLTSFSFSDGYLCPLSDHRDGSKCVVLDVLGLLYAKELGVIACKTLAGGCLIPVHCLARHLKDHHAKNLKLGSKGRSINEWARIANHIIVVHLGRLKVQGGFDRTSTVTIFYKCPDKDCKHWAIFVESAQSSEYNIRDHYKIVHKALFPTLQRYSGHLVQKLQLFSGSKSLSSVWFKLSNASSQSPEPEATLPHAPPVYTELPETPIDDRTSQATWMIDLGWVSYLASLGQEISINALRALVAPLGFSSQAPKGSSDAAFLEEGLRLVNKESLSYFMSANQFLNSRHAEVRAAVPAGYKCQKQVSRHPTRHLPKVLQAPHGHGLFHDPLSSKKEEGSIHGLGSFKIEGHPLQVKAADDLRKLLLRGRGHPDVDELRAHIHRLFVALTCPPSLAGSRIACPTDQGLLLLSVLGPNQFISAHAVLCHTSGLQYTFRCVMIHTSRLASFNAPRYQPWDPDNQVLGQGPVESSSDVMVEVEDTDEEVEEDDSGYEGTDSELPAGMLLCLDTTGYLTIHAIGCSAVAAAGLQGGSTTELPSFSESVTEYLRQTSHWVSAAPLELRNNPYQRNKGVIYILTPWSRRKEISSSSFSVAPNGQILTLRDSHDDPLIVDMQLWRRTVVTLCSMVLPDIISKMVPDVCADALKDFDFTNIQDDFTPPLHSLLSPSDGGHCLVDRDEKVVVTKLKGWLRQEQRLLAAFAAILRLPPAHASGAFNSLRSANPRAKQSNIRIANTALLFPRLASYSLRQYFFVLRAVGERVLSRAGMDVPGYSSIIWVATDPHPRRRKRKYEWTGQDVDHNIQLLTSDSLRLDITGAIVRLVSHAVFRSKTPSLFDDRNYPSALVVAMLESRILMPIFEDFRVPAFPNMTQAECLSRILVSLIWQGVLGLQPLHPVLKQMLHGSNIFPTSEFTMLAFGHARATILRVYRIREMMPPDKRFALVKDILDKQPAHRVQQPSSHAPPSTEYALGDEVLREVTHAVLFGSGRPTIVATPPLTGLHVDDVTLAATLIVFSLNEWASDGLMKPVALDSDSLGDNPIFLELRPILQAIKDAREEDWIQLSTDVFSVRQTDHSLNTADITGSLMEIIGL
ncbi:hypothetical protein HGRIS_008832 [Hohenbuehelia grisea]|uniref:Uncharacterized protein n=1 Tax=Hohenbuehelia grisea TaxID=104357 RepID=A0ABR3IZN7_9AGAR